MSIALAEKFKQFNERVRWACHLRVSVFSLYIYHTDNNIFFCVLGEM